MSVTKLKSLLFALPNPSEFIATLTEKQLVALYNDWPLWARQDQLPEHENWQNWLLLGGRGSGKTRAGAEYIKLKALTTSPIALIGETFADVREVMIEGVSGLRAIALPHERPVYEATRKRLVFPNGAIAQIFSGEDPESLRGPQFALAWVDELAKYKHAQEVWDMLAFALRVGERPRAVITTTPRNVPIIKKLLEDKNTLISRSKTQDNAANLAQSFMQEVTARYGGTRLGRQELEGELLEDRPEALWNRATIESCRVSVIPPLKRVVVAIDPPASSKIGADKCGIVAAGISDDNTIYVLHDATKAALQPHEWANRAIMVYHKFDADCLVAEINQGGEMVMAVLREVDPTCPVKPVRATRGKYIRAEPIALLYSQGRVKHGEAFPELEDEMCDFTPDGLSNHRSPDRLDALVWALTALNASGKVEPRIRGV
jgi:phage terminase large subunit-like protein